MSLSLSEQHVAAIRAASPLADLLDAESSALSRVLGPSESDPDPIVGRAQVQSASGGSPMLAASVDCTLAARCQRTVAQEGRAAARFVSMFVLDPRDGEYKQVGGPGKKIGMTLSMLNNEKAESVAKLTAALAKAESLGFGALAHWLRSYIGLGPAQKESLRKGLFRQSESLPIAHTYTRKTG